MRKTYVYRQLRNAFLIFAAKFIGISVLAMLASMSWSCQSAQAQRARFPDFFQAQPGTQNVAAQSIVTGPGQATTLPPPVTWQPPPTASGPFVNTPATVPYQAPNQVFPVFPRGDQQVVPNFAPQAQPVPQFAPNSYPYQGTGSNWLPSVDWSVPQQAWSSFQNDFLPRVLERPRARYTYIVGGETKFNINDLELATTATIPRFLQGNQPLRITPGFIFHFWDGPNSVLHPGYDMPAQAYSTYLAFDHLTDTQYQSGLESNFTIGYYSDFSNTSSAAFRLTGSLVGWTRLNCYTIGKFGVEYLDRVGTKILPAFGVYMTPNPDIRFDLFFPRSKLAHRLPNLNDYEAWLYVNAEYGGGSWAIKRAGGMNDQVDINDVRTSLGVEWIGPRRVTGFFELGYVFERELLYRSDESAPLALSDAFMLRTGFAF